MVRERLDRLAAVFAAEAPVVVDRPAHQQGGIRQRQQPISPERAHGGQEDGPQGYVGPAGRSAQDGHDAGTEQIDEGEPADGSQQKVEQIARARALRGDDHDASGDLMPRSGLVQRARRACLRSMTLGKLTSVVNRLTIQ
ncbi:hypothetical protein G6F22_017697 [Rhizopus arrhizus]|nr:hypothetical protein G6F22_017697 [Rhizopus arrhizus]